MFPLLPTTLNDEPVAVNVTAAPDLTTAFAVVASVAATEAAGAVQCLC